MLSAEDLRILVQQHALSLFRIYGPIKQLIGLQKDLNESWTRRDRALDQCLRQWVFNILLQGSTQRTRTVGAIGKRLVENPLLGLIRDGNRDRLLCQVLIQLRDHKLENLDQVVLAQGAEQDDFVQPVQELRIEGAFDFALDQLLDLSRDHVFLTRLEAQPFAPLQVPCANVRGHDDDGVFEIDGVAQTVGQLTVFKYL